MMDNGKKKRVLCPVSGKDGKTYWVRLGTAFVNHDNSINVYLDSLPTNGKLQLRDWEDSPWEKRAPAQRSEERPSATPQDDLPF